jgi:hypothetical protein
MLLLGMGDTADGKVVADVKHDETKLHRTPPYRYSSPTSRPTLKEL